MAFSTINKSADHFAPLLYSSNGTAIGSGGLTVTGFDFPPDWLGLKQRDAAESWGTYDTVRGVEKSLRFNGNNAEDTRTEGVTTFNSTGFICGNDSRINPSGTNPMIAYGWKAGTTTGLDTTGATITPSSYSLNATSKFSIIKYTGNDTNNAAVPHGLGVVPNCIIVKDLSGSEHWAVVTTSMTTDKMMYLNLDNGEETSQFGSTANTSVLFHLGTNQMVNSSSKNYIAYCFAEVDGYAKFSKYIGNGLADGPFVYTGFKPSWLLVKNGSPGGSWMLVDNKRPGFNKVSYYKYDFKVEEGGAERDTVASADFLCNGFKVRTTSSDWNSTDNTYQYIVFGQPIISNSGTCATAR